MVTVYMLTNGDRWYKATHHGNTNGWVEQDQATVWTTKQGPAAAKSQWLAKWRRRHSGEDDPVLTVVEFHLQTPTRVVITRDEDGDWSGLYVNGELVYQNHRISADDVLEALGIEYETRGIDLGDGGSFPQDYKDLKNG